MAGSLALQRAWGRWEPGTRDYQQITRELGTENYHVVLGYPGSSRYVLESGRQAIVRQ